MKLNVSKQEKTAESIRHADSILDQMHLVLESRGYEIEEAMGESATRQTFKNLALARTHLNNAVLALDTTMYRPALCITCGHPVTPHPFRHQVEVSGP